MQIEPLEIYPQPPGCCDPCRDPASYPNYAKEARDSANAAAAASAAAKNYSELAEDALDDFINYAYSKSETDELLDSKADSLDLEDYYTKSESDILWATKANVSDLNNYYTKTAADTLLAAKADASALNDYYTKTATDTLLAGKTDTSALNTILTDFVKVVVKSIGSITVSANSTWSQSSYDISASIPAGYKCIDVAEAGSGNNHMYFYNCSLNSNGTSCIINIKNINTSNVTATPYIKLWLIKEV